MRRLVAGAGPLVGRQLPEGQVLVAAGRHRPGVAAADPYLEDGSGHCQPAQLALDRPRQRCCGRLAASPDLCASLPQAVQGVAVLLVETGRSLLALLQVLEALGRLFIERQHAVEPAARAGVLAAQVTQEGTSGHDLSKTSGVVF